MKPFLKTLIFLSLISAKSFGWGAYGHEQINSEAIDLIKQSPLGACFDKNRDFIMRLAVTPDLDWKMSSQDFFALKVYELADQFPKDPTNVYFLSNLKKVLDQEKKKKAKNRVLSDDLVLALGERPSDNNLLGQLRNQELEAGKLGKLSYEVLQKKKSVDKDEHSLHFWEADAYSKTISDLKSGPNFDGDDLQDYEKRAKANEKEITKVDPCKEPSGNPSRDVIQHGTAPWRIYTLLKLGSKTLAEAARTHNQAKFNEALVILGAAGHYVGDMGQPFHATLNYDGQGTGPATMGIHSIYEEKILERYGKQKEHARQNKITKLWAPLSATNDEVDKYARLYFKNGEPSDLADDEIIPKVFKLVSDGYPLINILLPTFKEARLADPKYQQMDLPIADCEGHSKHQAVHAVTTEAFMNKMIQVPNVDHSISVLESAEKRMGEASAVLADLWLTAFKLSKLTDAEMNALCPQIDFTPAYAGKEFRETVIKNYPDITHHKPLSDFDKYASAKTKLDSPEEGEESSLDNGEGNDQDIANDDSQRQPNSVKKRLSPKK